MRITRMQAAGVLMILTMIGLTGCANAAEEPLRVPTSSSSSGEGAAAGDAAGGGTDSPSVGPSVLPSPGADPAADVAAAIAVYEAYVAASNEIVVADEATWEGLLSLVTGALEEGTIGSLESMHDNGDVLVGEEVLLSAVAFGADPNRVVIDVCIDRSAADTRNSAGESVLDPNREPVWALRVRAIPTSVDPVVWKVDYIVTRDDGPSC